MNSLTAYGDHNTLQNRDLLPIPLAALLLVHGEIATEAREMLCTTINKHAVRTARESVLVL